MLTSVRTVTIPIRYFHDSVNPQFSFWSYRKQVSWKNPIIIGYHSVIKSWINLGRARSANLIVSQGPVSNSWKGIVSESGDRVIITGVDDGMMVYLDVEFPEPLPDMAGFVYVCLEAYSA